MLLERRETTKRKQLNLNDIMGLFQQLDEDGITAPKFVADYFNSMTPLSGFEVIASRMVDLVSEIEALRIEVINLKEGPNSPNRRCILV